MKYVITFMCLSLYSFRPFRIFAHTFHLRYRERKKNPTTHNDSGKLTRISECELTETKQQSSSRWWALDSMSREKTLDSTHTDAEWMMWKTEEKNSLSFLFLCLNFHSCRTFLIFLFFPPRSFYTESPHHHVVLKKVHWTLVRRNNVGKFIAENIVC